MIYNITCADSHQLATATLTNCLLCSTVCTMPPHVPVRVYDDDARLGMQLIHIWLATCLIPDIDARLVLHADSFKTSLIGFSCCVHLQICGMLMSGTMYTVGLLEQSVGCTALTGNAALTC